MTRHLTLAFALVAMVAAVPATAVTNLIINGSFEDGLAGFTHTNAPSAYGAVILSYGSNANYGTDGGAYGEAVTTDSAAGSLSPDAAGGHGVYFVADDAVNETLSQLTKLHPGNYEVGFDAYLPQNGMNNPNDATFSGQIIGINVASFTASQVGATQWYHFSGVAGVSKSGFYDTAFVFNSFGAPAKDVVIDRVYAIATTKPSTVVIPATPTATIPEPAMWGLMVAGFGLVGSSLRRRNGSVVAA